MKKVRVVMAEGCGCHNGRAREDRLALRRKLTGSTARQFILDLPDPPDPEAIRRFILTNPLPAPEPNMEDGPPI